MNSSLCRWLLLSTPLLPFALGTSARAEATWIEVTSPHFRVLTDGSIGDGRAVANEFEQMRHVLALEFNDPEIGTDVPLTIVAARDGGTFKSLDPWSWKASNGNIAGQFHRGWEKQFAIIRLDTWTDQNQVVVYHEYTHSVLHSKAHWLPNWLDEGIAEFYGYTRFESNRTLIGAPSARASSLRTGALLPVTKMLEEFPDLRDEQKADLFYAESWAMVHYMMFDEGMGRGKKLNEFFKKIEAGTPQLDAFKEVFGDPAAFDKSFMTYVLRLTLKATVLPPDPSINPKTFPERKLNAAETQYELGSYQVGEHNLAAGRVRIEKALALDRNLAGAHEELGFLDFEDGKDEEATKEWKTALALDPSRPRSLFALTMIDTSMTNQTPEQLKALRATLQHIVDLSPKFAPAYVELALVDWRLGAMQKAFGEVKQAEKLEPWRAGYHILAGRVLLANNQPVAAATYSRYVAERWQGPDHNEAVDLWDDVPASARGAGVPLVLDMPKGVEVTRGVLTDVSCGTTPGAKLKITVTPDQPGAAPLTFDTDGRFTVGFSDSFWWGEDHFTTCHHLAGHPVVIAYKAADKHLLDMEVRDDLPRSTPAPSTTTAIPAKP